MLLEDLLESRALQFTAQAGDNTLNCRDRSGRWGQFLTKGKTSATERLQNAFGPSDDAIIKLNVFAYPVVVLKAK